jgi:phage tail-like protein
MARRVKLIERLPRIWRRLDSEHQLENFLKVLDASLDKSHDQITELLELRSVDKVPDKFLYFLSALVGHTWRDDKDILWNRERIRDAIHRHSYKGTLARLADSVKACGGESHSVQDNASKLLVLSRQGRLSHNDAYMVTKDYWHDGAFVLRVDNLVDFTELLIELLDTIPAGEKWSYEINSQSTSYWESIWTSQHSTLHSSGNILNGLLGFGKLSEDLFLSWEPNLQTAMTGNWNYQPTTGDMLTMDSNLKMTHTDVDFDSPMSNPTIQEGAQITSVPN